MTDRDLHAEIKRLTRRLGSFRRSVREDAARRLDEIGPELIAAAANAAHPLRDRAAWVLGFIAYAVAMEMLLLLAGDHIRLRWFFFVAGGLFGVGTGRGYNFGQYRLNRVFVEYVATRDEVHFRGVLLNALTDPRLRLGTRRAAAMRLAHVLAEHPEADLPFRIGARQLIANAARGRDEEIAIAALRVIGHSRQTESLSLVRHIALGGWGLVGGSGRNPRVRAAAMEVLPELERLAGQGDTKSVLLRPAEAPAAETLLRPAQPAAEADAALLLRPSGAEDDERPLRGQA